MNGILVQLPVPKHISERKVCNAVAPEKDVDGFHIVNVGRFCVDLKAMVPATPAGVIEMLKRTGIYLYLYIYMCIYLAEHTNLDIC